MFEHHQTVIDSVNSILKDTNLNPITEMVMGRLVSFGYDPTDEDAWMIAYNIKGTVNHVLNEINHTKIPEGLIEMVTDMICGEVLNAKFLTGQLELDSLDLDGMIQSVKEGDTQVNFNTDGSNEVKLKNLLSWLIQGKGCDLLCYRRMRW